MPGISAVIFDMYETLVLNSPSLWLKTFDEICQEQGLPLTGQQLWDKWKPMEMIFRKKRYELDYPFKTYEQAWRECFTSVFQEIEQGDSEHAVSLSMRDQAKRPLYEEASEVVTRLYQADGLRVGLLSNADNKALDPLVQSHGLRFHQIVSSETAQAYKPVPRAFELMLERIGVAANECLYVGDSQHDDVQGASAMGMQTAWINRSGAVLDASLPTPDYQIKDLRELYEIIGTSQA